ncbi:MAG: GntR family transcriptional regulator [Geminicoccaceae bacterium]
MPATGKGASAGPVPSGTRGGDEASGLLDLFAGRAPDRRNGPLYRQIADIIREPMLAGRLRPGRALPREADLARFFGVSLITVRHALRELESEGRVRKRSAKPSVVTSPPPKPGASFSFDTLASIIASTKGREIEILDYRRRRSARAQEVFGLGPSDHTFCLQAVLRRDSRPIACNTFHFAPAIGGRLKREHFDDVVVFRSVQRHLGIRLRGARVTVWAEVADAELARRLDCDEGAPIMAMEMIYLDEHGAPVELTINRNRADEFSLTFEAESEPG